MTSERWTWLRLVDIKIYFQTDVSDSGKWFAKLAKESRKVVVRGTKLSDAEV